MIINELTLENFRSYSKKSFHFSPDITLVVGPNTAGKSNLMEAIFLIAFGKSPRATLDREMLKTGEKLGFVQARVSASDPRNLEVALTESGKRFRVNGVGRRLSDFSSHFHAVLFSPQDLEMVTGRPDLRRKFMDFILGGVDREYAHSLSQFDKVRKRRNRLLEQINKGFAYETELGFWDAALLEHGVVLQDKRKDFFNEINGDMGEEGLELLYIPSGLTAELLMEYRPRELGAGTSLIGPHRDDFSFVAPGNRDLSAYGSRGEQRKAVLALKKAELEFVEQKIGSRPVLLLDDIFSELDEENRKWVLDLLPGGQVIITTADRDHVPQDLGAFEVLDI